VTPLSNAKAADAQTDRVDPARHRYGHPLISIGKGVQHGGSSRAAEPEPAGLWKALQLRVASSGP
jgi:hypothetical protein